VEILAIFGPTAVGKTGVAIEVGRMLRERGEDPVAVSCDAIQVYRGLEVLSGAPAERERSSLEHRLLGIVPIDDEFSAGRFADLAHAEIDALLADGRRPIVVGGTGLYMRAALSDLELRPPVPAAVRAEVEAELERRGPEALHGELSPELASGVHPNDRKRIARLTELSRLGIAPHADAERLWSEALRLPTVLVGLTVDRDELRARIDARVEAMVRAGAIAEVRAAEQAGVSRTARSAIGFTELLAGDLAEMKRAQWRFARRQLTWMRRMEGVTRIDRTDRDDTSVAAEIVAGLE
jgi:tRNA dimethylallyltransferase